MEDLKRCPYCGRKAKIESSTWMTYDSEGELKTISYRYRVSCSKCGCCTDWQPVIGAALVFWNRREYDV